MLSVIMLNVVLLNVVAPTYDPTFDWSRMTDSTLVSCSLTR
jgi:hypothetical protein